MLRTPAVLQQYARSAHFPSENGGAVYRKSCIINDTRTAPCFALPQSFNNTHALLIFLRKMAARAYCWRIERESPHHKRACGGGFLSLFLYHYIIPMPGAPIPAGAAGAASLISATRLSVVRSVDATLVAF